MSVFLKSGKIFKVTAKASLNVHERLPVGTYTIGVDCGGNYFLETIEDFEVKGKLYGDTTKNADRILRTFNHRDVSTGVLLTGEKGSGKTMLSKYISLQAAEQGIPTIVVNQPWCGEKFNMFLQSIEQPTVVIFDEFEKVYSCSGKQQQLLTLLDGVYPSKKLFLFTCNDKWKLNNNMQNRPGRIYYMLEYYGLDIDFIREYCIDNLKNQEHVCMVCAISRAFKSMNFDMLKALVEEMNRYDETPAEALKFLNMSTDFCASSAFKVEKLVINEEELKIDESVTNSWSGRPLKDNIRLYYGPSDNRKSVTFSAKHLKAIDSETGNYFFQTANGKHMVLLTPAPMEFKFNFNKLQSIEGSTYKSYYSRAIADEKKDLAAEEKRADDAVVSM